jgi:hypothetical protein
MSARITLDTSDYDDLTRLAVSFFNCVKVFAV